VLEWGVDEPRIVSIKLDGEYTAQRASETIVGVDAPNGIHVGDNPVVVQELVYGDPDTRTVDTTVTVPAGTALGGYLVASSPSAALDDDEDVSSILVGDEGISLDVFGSDARESIAQIADDLNHSQPNNTMIVTFQPGQSDLSSSDDGDDSGDDSGSLAGQVAQLKNTLSTDPITNDLTTLRPTDSRARADLTDMLVEADPSAIPYGEFSDVVGEIDGPDVKSVVSLYASQPGTTTETLVETQTVKPVQGLLPFDFQLDEMFTNTTFRVHVDAGSDLDSGNAWTTGNKTVTVSVRAITSLSMSASSLKAGKKVKLTASVYPASAAGGGVVFERQVHRGWKRIASATLSAPGSVAKATYKWKPAKGTNKVRARYLGGVFNATSNSATKTVKVK